VDAGLVYVYAVATVSTIDKIIGLFCRIQSPLQVSFAKETSNFIDPTNRSHPIQMYVWRPVCRLCTRAYTHMHFFLDIYAYMYAYIYMKPIMSMLDMVVKPEKHVRR